MGKKKTKGETALNELFKRLEKQEPIDGDELLLLRSDGLKHALSNGITSFVKQNSRFSGQENFLASYIDIHDIENYFTQERQRIGYENKKFTREDYVNLVNSITYGIQRGSFFNDKGKRLFLREGLEEKTKGWFGNFAHKIIRGESELDRTVGAFKEIYELMEKGNYGKHMPQLQESAQKIYQAGFVNSALDIMYDNGIMNNTAYKVFKGALVKKTKEETVNAQNSITSYFQPRKIAATFFAIAGVGIILTNNSMTGNIVGSSATNNISDLILGGGLLLLSVLTLLIRKKKQ